MGLASVCVLPQHMRLSQLTSLCQSAQVCRSSKKLQHTTRSFLVHFSLWSPDKCSSTMQCKIDMHVLSKKIFHHVSFSCVCFSRTSSLLCLLQLNIPSRVCPSKTPSNRLSKEPLSFHFTSPFPAFPLTLDRRERRKDGRKRKREINP